MLGVGFFRYVTTLFSVSTCLLSVLDCLCFLCVGVGRYELHTTLVALDLVAFWFGLFLGCCLSVGRGIVPHSQHGCYVEVCGCECGRM